MSHVTLIGILGLVAVAACWALAVVLYRVSTADSVARKLAVLLVVEGFVLVTAGYPEFTFDVPDSFFELHPMLYFLSSLVHHLGDAAMIALYPTFLALALSTNLTRPFVNTRVRIGLAIGSAMLGLAVVFTESPIVITLFYSMVTLLFVYALVASIHAWRTAKTDLIRERAGIFALAFGLRDLGWSLSYGIAAWLMWTQPELASSNDMPGIGWLGKIVYALGTLVAVPLIAYGILRTQLFDIDLRIRWTIKQSTVGIAIFAIVFVVSEGAESLLSAQLGNYWGLLAAAVIAIVLRPLQAFAERVAAAAMPNTQNTPEYKADRKRQVYEAAVAEALQDGGMSDKERSLLNRLRDSLDISLADAEALERELQLGSAHP
jgi:hypothetical protein